MRPLELTVRDFAAWNEESRRLKVKVDNCRCATKTRVFDEDTGEWSFVACWQLLYNTYVNYCDGCKKRHLLREQWRTARAKRGSYLAAIVRRGKAMLAEDAR